MKKVGIVTMVGYDNYGNLLQNYAVKKLLEDMGYQAITLNNERHEQKIESFNKISVWNKLNPSYVKQYFKVKAFRSIGCKNTADYFPNNILKLFKNKRKFQQYKVRRIEKFKEFRRKYIPYEQTAICNENFFENDYIAFVCGSDVVWHPNYHYNKIDDFLGFAPKYKRIALAPSFGVSEIPDVRKDAYKVWLEGIEYLSVRENAGATIIRNLIHREAEVLPDPTLSISYEHWRSVSKRPNNMPSKPYVLCYFLGSITLEYSKWIKKCANIKGKEVISVCDANFLQYYDVDPWEFLWLIDHADAVFTDSFHGIVFSMLFHTPFVAFRRVEKGLSIFSRIESLLNCMNMESREFGKVEINQFDELDFKYVDKKIEYLREKEKLFLGNAMKVIEERSLVDEK